MDGKLWRENEKKNFFECVWLSGNEGKQMVGPRYFLPGPTKKFSPQNGNKNCASFLDKNAHV